MQKNLLACLALASLASLNVNAASRSSGSSFPWGPTVIYGDDNRLDLYQVTNTQHLDLADSTVALVKSTSIVAGAADVSTLQARTFGEAFNLCAEEPFREQKSAAFCSGFLVNEDTVVTAGHCIRGPSDCSSTKFVFGYGLKTPTANYTEVRNEEIYSCQSITHTEVNGRGADFAVIKLDRRVLNHRALEMRREGAPAIGSEMVVIGHPSGLPTKVAAGATVRRLDTGYFVASLDTYGGNSGSAVFNNTDGKVEGILVRGETDFRNQGSCTVSNRCAADGCRGEDVTLISTVLSHIP